MAKSLRVTRIVEDPATGTVDYIYKFGDDLDATGESGFQFGNRDDVLKQLLNFNENVDEVLMLRLLLAQTAVGPNGLLKNDTSVIGRTITLDVTGGTPIRFS